MHREKALPETDQTNAADAVQRLTANPVPDHLNFLSKK
jgi:hypothetical protein